jgi:hypothetical protein
MLFDVVGNILVSARDRFVTVNRKVLWRNILSVALSLAVVGLSATLLAESPVDISTSVNSDEIQHVRVVVEVRGVLKLNTDGQKVTRLPLRVTGDVRYDERTLQANRDQIRKSVRHYDRARATISVGDSPIQTQVRNDRCLIVTQVAKNQQTLFSPLGPLTREELELLDVQGSTALLDDLAPTRPVKLSDEWEHDDALIAALLGLDAISQSDAMSTLRQVEGDVAIVDMSGTVSGAVDGVSSDIELKAKYNIDLRQRRVTWLAMSIRENRAIGHAAPGFEVTARIRVALSERASAPELSDARLQELPLGLHTGAKLLNLPSSAGAFRLLHARNWQVMVDRHDVTILRMIDHGELIAQCNISSLPDLPRGEQVAMSAFQADIKRALGDNFGQFVEAGQTTNDRGLRVLRAVASGVASELPVQWVYHHISNGKGRQTALVFTMDSKVIEAFAEADRAIISSFQFTERPVGNPTTANRVENSARAVTVPATVNR